MSLSVESKGHSLWALREMTSRLLLLLLLLTASLPRKALMTEADEADYSPADPETEAEAEAEADAGAGAGAEAEAETEAETEAIEDSADTHTLLAETDPTELEGTVSPDDESPALLDGEDAIITEQSPDDGGSALSDGEPGEPEPEDEVNGSGGGETSTSALIPNGRESEADDMSVLLIAVPVVLVLIVGVAVAVFFFSRRRKSRSLKNENMRDDPFLEEGGGEKVPMPMFEDDVPSVLELEMEDLEKWMVKDGADMKLDSGQK